MRIQQFEILMETQLQKLFGLCCALTPSLKLSEQLFVDAYTVFVVEEKEFLAKEDFDTTDNSERLSVKRYLFNSISRHIVELASKKSRYFDEVLKNSQLEYTNFFELKNNHKAVLFLKEKLNIDLKDLQEIFALQPHQVKEIYHNALYKLNQDSVADGPTDELDLNLKYLVNSFVFKTLPSKLRLNIETEINSNKKLYSYYESRIRLKEFTQSLIPSIQLSRSTRSELIESISEINTDIFPKEKFYLFHKISKFMTTPIVEI